MLFVGFTAMICLIDSTLADSVEDEKDFDVRTNHYPTLPYSRVINQTNIFSIPLLFNILS